MNISIRLKLTFWYSFILIITSGVLIMVVNAFMMQHYQKTPQQLFTQIQKHDPELFARVAMGGRIDRRELDRIIEEVREGDRDRIRTITLTIFSGLMALSFGGGYIIAGRMLAPIRKINDATRHITVSTLHPIEGANNTNDELGELTTNFNAMIQRLHNSFHVQKQFVENASHELKTPLTIVQTNLEAALEDDSMSREEMKAYIQQALQSSQFMNRLTEDLLLLSVAKEQIPFSAVKIRETVQSAVTQLQPLATEQKKKIELHLPHESKIIQGNNTLLMRAVMNCIENGIKYAHETITVTVSYQQNNIHITIHDDGEGIPAEHIPKVFDRFYRVDTSRSRTSGGTGLGLAITKSIIEKHNGSLSLSSVVHEGTTVVMIFS